MGKDTPLTPMPGPPGMPMPINPAVMHGPPHPDLPGPGGPPGWNKFQENYLTFLSGSPGKKFSSYLITYVEEICFAISLGIIFIE